MSWMGLLLLALGGYLAYKLVGALLKVLMVLLALVGAYWFLAPHLGWPTVSELFYVLGPDLGGRRIEELAQPSELAKEASGRIVDDVLERFDPSSRVPVDESPAPLPEPASDATALPAPLEEHAADPYP